MLKFVGCLVTFDGRRCNGMTHASIDGPPNYPLLQTSALLPSMSGYLIFLDGNPSTHTNVIIQVDANGHITASGPGKARVKIVQPIIDPVTQIQTPAVVIGLP